MFTAMTATFSHAQRSTKGAGLSLLRMQLPEAYLERKSTVQTPDDSLLRPANQALGFGFNYSYLYRLYQFHANQSIMLAANPMFGFFFTSDNLSTDEGVVGDYGFPIMFQMPLMLQFARGMVSTNESDREHGFGIGLGVEATWYHDKWRYSNPNSPFSSFYNFFSDNRFIAAPSLLIRPAAAVYWRTWSKRDVPMEFSLQYSTTQQSYALGTANRSFLRFSYTIFWNY